VWDVGCDERQDRTDRARRDTQFSADPVLAAAHFPPELGAHAVRAGLLCAWVTDAGARTVRPIQTRRRLIEDADLRKTLMRNARRTVMEHHTLEKNWQNWPLAWSDAIERFRAKPRILLASA